MNEGSDEVKTESSFEVVEFDPRAMVIDGIQRDAEAPKAFSDANPVVSLRKPVFLLVLSAAGGFATGSWALGLVLILYVVLDAFSDVVVGNILNPPFLDNRDPSEGLTQMVGKVCPYWPKASVYGPAYMGLKHEEVEIESKGGAMLRGWIIHPTRASKCSGFLICMHGAGRDRRAWLRHAPFLLDEGYTILVFDFRGHGCSDKGASEGGTSLGWQEQQDTVTVVKWARQSKPRDKIAILGTSTGAVAAILAVSDDEATRSAVACIVVENPFICPETVTSQTVSAVVFRVLICKNSSIAFAAMYPLMFAVRALSVLKTRWVLKARYGKVVNALDIIRKITTPLLLMHGTNDKIVSFLDTEELYMTAGVDAGPLGHSTRKEIWICEGAEHCQLWDKDRRGFEARVLTFLSRFM